MRLFVLAAAAALCASSITAHATTLDQQTAGINPNAPGYFGQFFSVGGTGSYTDVTFNFYSYSNATTPYAVGTGYLFSQPYGGAPGGLSPSDANFIASAVASNGVYDFGSSVSLASGQNYYFYEDTLLPLDTIIGQSPAEESFYASDAGSMYRTLQERSNNYQVNGTLVGSGGAGPTAVTPEPSSLVLLGTGLLAFAGGLRRRFA